MTKISQYTTLSNPTEDDILIGTDVNSSDETKNFSIGSIVNLVENGGRPYKVYTALLSQKLTAAPSAVVLENTLGGAIVWSYDDVGTYIGTLNGMFLENKTFYLIENTIVDTGEGYETNICFITRISNNEILIYTNDAVGLNNSLLDDTPVEIRVYN